MKCQNCGNDISLLDKNTGKRIDQCPGCNSNFVHDIGKIVAKSIVGLIVLTSVIGILDFGLLITLVVIVPYMALTFIYINRVKVRR